MAHYTSITRTVTLLHPQGFIVNSTIRLFVCIFCFNCKKRLLITTKCSFILKRSVCLSEPISLSVAISTSVSICFYIQSFSSTESIVIVGVRKTGVVCLSVCLCVCVSVCLSVCQCVCVSVRARTPKLLGRFQ